MADSLPRLAFAGDLSFNDALREHGRQELWAAPFLRRLDGSLLVANLECTIDTGRRTPGRAVVLVDESSLSRLLRLPRVVVNLANNHVLDCWDEGLSRLLTWLDSNDIPHFGAGLSSVDAHQPLRLDYAGNRLSFLGRVAPETDPIPRGYGGSAVPALLDEGSVVDLIRAERNSGRLVVVSLHWGAEYVRFPSPTQVSLADRLVEAGAHIVWGHHSHVLQGYRRSGRSLVFFSLGNSVFPNVRIQARVDFPPESSYGAVPVVAIPSLDWKETLFTRYTDFTGLELVEAARVPERAFTPIDASGRGLVYKLRWRLSRFRVMVALPIQRRVRSIRQGEASLRESARLASLASLWRRISSALGLPHSSKMEQ